MQYRDFNEVFIMLEAGVSAEKDWGACALDCSYEKSSNYLCEPDALTTSLFLQVCKAELLNISFPWSIYHFGVTDGT